MIDLGWSEMAIIALVATMIIGPKELPTVLRSVGQWTRKLRSMTREFQSSIDDMVREAELEDARKALKSTKNIDKVLQDTLDPTGDVADEAKSIERSVKADTPASPSSSAAKATPTKPAVAETVKAAASDEVAGPPAPTKADVDAVAGEGDAKATGTGS